MNWKQDYIDGDKDRIRDFLEQHIDAAGIKAPRAMVVEISSHDTTIYVSSEGDSIARLWIARIDDGYTQSFEIMSLKVTKYQGQHIGAMLLKTALAYVQAKNGDCLSIYCVRDDGLSFWPRYGSFPKKSISFVENIQSFLGYQWRFLSVEARARLEQIVGDYKQDPVLAWRAASQMEERMANGRLVSAELFETVQRGYDHWLLPGEPTTSAILQKRLGVLPPFRPPADCFAPQIAALRLHPR